MGLFIESVIEAVPEFFELIRQSKVEIYNEFSLQHEFGCFLRDALPVSLKIQFERPVGYFQNYVTGKYEKKEIDITVFSSGRKQRMAIELKFPRNGQYPEQMYSACRDLVFLEQLVAGGFTAGLFIMAADDPGFRYGREKNGIYKYFRNGAPIFGTIRKPTGSSGRRLSVRRRYFIEWKNVTDRLHYCMVPVLPKRAG